jgi:hypothetical protein
MISIPNEAQMTLEGDALKTPVNHFNQASFVGKPRLLATPDLDYGHNLSNRKNMYVRPTQGKLRIGSQGRKVTESL